MDTNDSLVGKQQMKVLLAEIQQMIGLGLNRVAIADALIVIYPQFTFDYALGLVEMYSWFHEIYSWFDRCDWI